MRLMPEFDLFFILATVEVIRRFWSKYSSQQAHIAAALVIQVFFLSSLPYLSQAWKFYRWDGGYQGRIEYRVAQWMHQNLPNARALTTGSVRFWYNAWFTGSQTGGGSEQGLLNSVLAIGHWEIAAGTELAPALLWLQATGSDVVIVHDKNSQEMYHDFADIPKYNTLPVLWDSGHGDRIHQVPRRYPGLARVVDTAKASALKPLPDGNLDGVRAYVDVIEKGPDSPASSKIEKMDTIRVQAHVAQGQSVVLLQTYDPFWRAYSNGVSLPIRKDAIGFMLIEAPPGTHDILMKFETPTENWVGRIVTLLSLCIVMYLFAMQLFAAKPRTP
jgi:multidrug transporter EmrE-like cation transporter